MAIFLLFQRLAQKGSRRAPTCNLPSSVKVMRRVFCGIKSIKLIFTFISQVHQRDVLEDHEMVSRKIMTKHIDFSAISA